MQTGIFQNLESKCNFNQIIGCEGNFLLKNIKILFI
jgi:hypothetical protein